MKRKTVKIHKSTLVELIKQAGITEFSTKTALELVNPDKVSESTALEFVRSAKKSQPQPKEFTKDEVFAAFKEGVESQKQTLPTMQLLARETLKLTTILLFAWLVLLIFQYDQATIFQVLVTGGLITILHKML